MGLGTLLFALMAGGSAVKCGIENAQMMSKPYKYLDDGTPVYLDRLGNQHINGEKVISVYNSEKKCIQEVGQRTGKVYFDPEVAQRKRQEDWNEELRQNAIREGKLIYEKYDVDRKKKFTCEISTGKYIAHVEGRADRTYWKYYASPCRVFKHYEESCRLSKQDSDNKPVEISKKEFEEFEIYRYTGLYSYSDFTNVRKINFYPEGYYEEKKREEARRKREEEKRDKEAEEARLKRLEDDARIHDLYCL